MKNFQEVNNQLDVLKQQIGTQVTIGKNFLQGEFLEKFSSIEGKLTEILGKFYVRIERDRITRDIKFGVNGQVVKTKEFLQAFFMYLQKSSIKGYFFLGVQSPLFKDIARVQWTELQRIELIGCQISNLQPLTWLNAPNFKSIYLRNNKITSLKSLQKTSFKNFTSIDLGTSIYYGKLDCNFFNDSAPLCRMRTVNFDQAKNSKFYVYITENQQNIGNLNFLFKMQNVQTSLIGENSTAGTYIKQPKTLRAIEKFQAIPKANNR